MYVLRGGFQRIAWFILAGVWCSGPWVYAIDGSVIHRGRMTDADGAAMSKGGVELEHNPHPREDIDNWNWTNDHRDQQRGDLCSCNYDIFHEVCHAYYELSSYSCGFGLGCVCILKTCCNGNGFDAREEARHWKNGQLRNHSVHESIVQLKMRSVILNHFLPLLLLHPGWKSTRRHAIYT